MAIIKRAVSETLKARQAQQQPLDAAEATAAANMLNKPASQAMSQAWSAQAIEQGLLPDRRSADPQQPETLSLGDRRQQYRRIEDRQLITKAYEEAQAIRESAFEQGFAAGVQQAQAQLADLQQQFNGLLHAQQDALLELTDEIGSLAVEVAERIIKTEVSCDDELVTHLVKDTLQKVSRQTRSILIKVHPHDIAMTKQFVKDTPVAYLEDAQIIVMDDPTVDRGSCVLETNSGMIDASFKTQLGILHQLFGRRLFDQASAIQAQQQQQNHEESV